MIHLLDGGRSQQYVAKQLGLTRETIRALDEKFITQVLTVVLG